MDNTNETINDVFKSEEYLNNAMKIDTISKVLIEHSDVPEELVNWLIEAVKDNTWLEARAKYNIHN